MYDSTSDTLEHIRKVQCLLLEVVLKLGKRAINHDESKLRDPEKTMYDRFTPLLRSLTYGSDEYKETLNEMGGALLHHYDCNCHHPEHFQAGIEDMSLIDLIEMVADWKAASLRHSDGSIFDSLEINKGRFAISEQLYKVFQNTIIEMGWAVKEDRTK